jgi:hypothetical protein
MGIAIKALGRRVGIDNAALLRIDQNHHRAMVLEQHAEVRLAVLQQPLGLFVGGDVLHRADNAADIAIAIHLGGLALVQYPDHLAAAAYQPVFDAVLTGLALEQGTDIVTDRGQIFRMHQCLPLRGLSCRV